MVCKGGHTKAASYRAFPLHAQSHGIPEAVKVAQLELANINGTHAFARKHNIVCESNPCDTVDIIYDEDAYKSGISAIKLIQDSMAPDDEAAKYEIFDAEEAKREFLVDGNYVKGAFKYAAGSINAYKFVIGVLKLCLARGLNLQTFTPVTSISRLEPGIWTATTPIGTITAKNLILATNGYTAHLLPQMQTKIVPLRGQITAHKPGPKLAKIHPDGLPTTYSFIYETGYEYMIPRPRISSVPNDFVGDIVIGGGIGMLPGEGLSEFGETDDTVLNIMNSKYLHESTARYFGSNWGEDDPASRVRKEWTGIMGITGDDLPYVGAVPGEEGLWISAGFNGHGMMKTLICNLWSNYANDDDRNGVLLKVSGSINSHAVQRQAGSV
jgi:glycine/D-amino acid oxidase-like deaminating enzyme